VGQGGLLPTCASFYPVPAKKTCALGLLQYYWTNAPGILAGNDDWRQKRCQMLLGCAGGWLPPKGGPRRGAAHGRMDLWTLGLWGFGAMRRALRPKTVAFTPDCFTQKRPQDCEPCEQPVVLTYRNRRFMFFPASGHHFLPQD
jgi:hypothetical protein